MKLTPKQKFFIGLGTAITIAGPHIPDINVNVNIPIQILAEAKKERPYVVVATRCELNSAKILNNNMQDCEYICKDGDSRIIHKITYSGSISCQKHITENVKVTKRKE